MTAKEQIQSIRQKLERIRFGVTPKSKKRKWQRKRRQITLYFEIQALKSLSMANKFETGGIILGGTTDNEVILPNLQINPRIFSVPSFCLNEKNQSLCDNVQPPHLAKADVRMAGG